MNREPVCTLTTLDLSIINQSQQSHNLIVSTFSFLNRRIEGKYRRIHELFFFAFVGVYIVFESVPVFLAVIPFKCFQSDVRNWSEAVSRREIDVFNLQACQCLGPV